MSTATKSSPKTSYNPPRFRQRADDPSQGYWFVWHGGKQCQLTKFGATRQAVKIGSKAYVSEVLPAFHRWVEDYEAKQQAAKLNLIATAVIGGGEITVADVCKNYISFLEREGNRSERYVAMAKWTLDNFCTGRDGKGEKINGIKPYKGFGNLPAENCTKQVLDSWVSFHPKWTQTKSKITPIKAAFLRAIEDRLIEQLPFAGFKAKAGKARKDHFSINEEKTFKGAIDDPCFGDFFAALIDTGARPNELATLTAKHVKVAPNGLCWSLSWQEWKNGRKKEKNRTIYLSAKWIEWTRKRLETIGEGEHLFSTSAGKRWDIHSWGRAFRSAKIGSGIKKPLVLYSCRHTFITRAIEKRVWTLSQIADYCGTSEKEIRAHYDHSEEDKDLLVSMAVAMAG